MAKLLLAHGARVNAADREGYTFSMLADYWPHGAVAREYGIFVDEVGAATTPTFWSLSWIADYPHAHDFLGLLLETGSTSNTIATRLNTIAVQIHGTSAW